MAKYIGRQINVWLWKETTRGTAVAVWAWIPKTDFSFEEKMETIQDESSIGVITDTRDSFVAKRWAEWDIAGNIEVNSFGYILLWLLWSVSSSVATTWAYSHAFTMNNSNQIQSLTLWIKDPWFASDMRFALASIDSCTITAEEWKQASFSVTFKALKGSTTTHTVTYPTDYKLLARMSVFKIASNLAWLTWAVASCIKSFEITFTKNLEEDYCLWSQEPRDFVNKQFTIEGSFTAMYENETDYQTFSLAGTKKALRFQMIDTSTTIWLSSNPTLTIDLPNCAVTEWSKTQGNDEVVMQTVTFKWMYSIADTSSVNATLVNTTVSY